MNKPAEILSKKFLKQIEWYCAKYNVPLEHLVEIISDQKVLPMIRGKAVEFIVFDMLKQMLNSAEWTVEKRDLNPQPNLTDQDIVVIHNRSRTEIIIECKSAVRNSFRLRTSRRPSPQFRVKCHKSRSYMGRATNDRYRVSDFDIVVSNVSNSLILSGKEYKTNDNPDVITYLENHYGHKGIDAVFMSSSKDWRFSLSKDIANSGVVERTPLVMFENDDHWKDIGEIEEGLKEILRQKSVGI